MNSSFFSMLVVLAASFCGAMIAERVSNAHLLSEFSKCVEASNEQWPL